MRHTNLVVAVLGALALTGTSRADDIDKKTVLTVNDTIMVPGKVLPPGKYVMKLANVTANRHVVQIFNEDQTQLQTTIMAMPNYQVQVKEDTVITFWETPAGVPRAIRAWFYPADNFGQEFAYPKEEAERISRANNNAKVLQLEGQADVQPVVSEVRQAETPSQVALVERTQPEPVAPQAEVVPQRSEVAVVTPVTPSPAPVTREQSSTDAIAQNTPAPRPTFPVNEETRIDQADGEVSELPRTASPMPLILLIGLCAIAGAFTLRRLQA